MTTAIFRLEWRISLVRRRLLLWNLFVPLILLAPVALSPAAAPHRAAVYAVFFVFFGTFGSAIPLIRDGGNGWNETLLLTGYGARRWILEQLTATSSIDVAQLLPAVVLIVAAAPTEGWNRAVAAVIALVAATMLGLLAANLLGVLVAALVRSLAEGALGCAVAALFALHFAGAFRSAPPGTWADAAQLASPFRPLVEVTRTLVATGSTPPVESFVWPIVTTLCALLLVVLAGPRVARRLSNSGF